MMTLWSIARSPLILGADMTQLDEATLALLTNDEVLAVNQASAGNRQLFEKGDLIAWGADVTGSKDKYLAVFNTGDAPAPVPVELSAVGFTGRVAVRDLWARRTQDDVRDTFAPVVPAHGTGLYRLRAR
jgi:alpha-galactosidase